MMSFRSKPNRRMFIPLSPGEGGDGSGMYCRRAIARIAMRWTPEGKRSRGRPKTTWRRTVEKGLRQLNYSWSTIENLAKHDPIRDAIRDPVRLRFCRLRQCFVSQLIKKKSFQVLQVWHATQCPQFQ